MKRCEFFISYNADYGKTAFKVKGYNQISLNDIESDANIDFMHDHLTYAELISISHFEISSAYVR